ncbi:MAG: hypothetical protein C0524_05115 [Rhodobacter sp.]|nr:hypothetical protein [Rhodobacter sp.]
MRKLLISTTALSVAMSPMSSFPVFAQTLAEDGSVVAPDGTVLCMPTADAACDLEAITLALQAAAEAAAAEAAAAAAEAAAIQAAAEAAAQAEADAAAQAEADAAAKAEADAAAQAEAEAAAQAEAEAAAQAEADAAAQAEADAAAQAEADAAAQAEADAAAQAEADAAAQAEAEAAAQAEADAAAQAEAEAAAQAEAEAAAQAEADAAAQAEADAAAQAEADAAAQAEAEAAAQAEAEAAAQAEADAAAEPTAEEPVADGIIDSATGEVIDPDVAAAAVAEAEAELAISDDGVLIDPAAGLKVAEPETAEIVDPVDAPEVSEAEVESLTELLTVEPTAIDPEAIAAAATLSAAPAAGETATPAPTPESEDLLSAVTETITENSVRTSAEEFAAAPVALAKGKKNKLSNLEKAGLFVLGALVVGAIIKSNKEERREESRVVSNTGDRVVVLRPDGTYQVLKDDDTVIRQPGSTVRTETFRDGSTRTIVERADGTQVVTIRDATGRVLRRATYDELGREIILIDDLHREEVVVVSDLPKPRKRIVISSRDNDAALKRELAAIEAERAGRKFSLRQIREIPEVRALAATIDVEPVTFASGSAAIAADKARNLADLGGVMQDLLDANPAEIFLIEGHTDATGKAAMNLALSDRRAESLALALTEYFDIPPENMVVQGYGETELLIDTQESEASNRRVEVRVITPLMRTTELR